MLIGGFQKFTLIDYPDKIAATVFTVGCNFRCPFCHNPEIVDPKKINYKGNIKEEEILEFLVSRKGYLDGVCITGGEPTLQIGLAEFVRNIKEMKFLVKIDTNGSMPMTIENLIERGMLDYLAIDIKTRPEKYKTLTTRDDIVVNLEKSINLIVNSSVEMEFRTTVVPGIVEVEDFDDIIDWINKINSKTFSRLHRYSIQSFRPQKTLNKSFDKVKPYPKDKLNIIAEKIRKHCKNVVVLCQDFE